MSTRLLSALIVAAFVGGISLGARADAISTLTTTLVGQGGTNCVATSTPGSQITWTRNWSVKCTWQCANGTNGDCDSPNPQTANISATGECRPDSDGDDCEPVIGEPFTFLSGAVNNEQHTWRVEWQNKDAFQAGNPPGGPWMCQIASTGFAERYFPAVYEADECSAEQCPGMEEEIEDCELQESTWWDYNECTCVTSPIIIDLDGDGLSLTWPADGVGFDLDSDGAAEQLSWTHAADRDGFLVLDRNSNGTIDNGKEFFGSATEQPHSAEPNGFLALGVFDLPANGGNMDGRITVADSHYPKLRVWFDLNHDGVSQPNELKDLGAIGVVALSLDYKVSRRRDPIGNLFRYVGRVLVDDDPNDPFRGRPRLAIDVFLQPMK